MKQISLPFTISLVIVSAIIGIAFGYYLTPEYRLTMFDKTSMDLGQPDRWLDLRYLNAMITHHRIAMLLADQAKETSQRNEIRNLSHDILSNEPKLIDELYNWKKDWYQDTRKVTDPVAPNLGSFDTKYDLRFLNALIAHHQAGIAMTQEIRSKSSNQAVLNNADAVESFLTTSLIQLYQWRQDWYQINGK